MKCTGIRIFVAIAAMAMFVACGDDENGNDNGNATANQTSNQTGNQTSNGGGDLVDLSYSGTADNYDDVDATIVTRLSFENIADGQIDSDGTFSVDLNSITQIFGDPTDELRTPPTLFECDIDEEHFSDPEVHLYTINMGFGSSFMDELHVVERTPEDERQIGTLRLGVEYDQESSGWSTFVQEVSWIYVDRDVDVEGEECGDTQLTSNPMTNVDLELEAGWNEIVATRDTSGEHTWVDFETTDRPGDAEWVVTDGIR